MDDLKTLKIVAQPKPLHRAVKQPKGKTIVKPKYGPLYANVHFFIVGQAALGKIRAANNFLQV